MITLHVENLQHEFKAGEVRHLFVKKIYASSPGRWRLEVRDVTPLQGAEPVSYACGACGIIEEAKADGSLPDRWEKRQFEKGSKFVCSDCLDQPLCRVCGCSDFHACFTEGLPCHWVLPNLCSACFVADGE